MKTIAIVDYGMGNLRSVAKAIEHVAEKNARVYLTSSAQEIYEASHIVFPGQGAAKGCLQALQNHQLVDVIKEVASSKPFLGICMGLQVLLQSSEENGGTPCLGVFDGQVKFFGNTLSGTDYKIPHMGWNQVVQAKSHPLWENIPDAARFYFVHSYYVQTTSKTLISSTTNYGIDFTSAISCDNLFAVQFHPEKSAKHGLKLLQNFVNWNGMC